MISELIGRIAHDVDNGLLPAGQVAVAIDGDLIVDESFGTATSQSRLPLFSVSKVLPASAIWRLFSTGDVRPEDLVITHLPWFSGDGKDRVTVEQLLLHTAGFPNAPLGPPAWFDADERRSKMVSWRCTSPPGEQFAYHPTSASWVVGEILAERLDLGHADAIHQLVTEPLGLPPMLGIDDATIDVCDATLVGDTASDPATALPGHATLPAEITDHSLLQFNHPETRLLGVPGAGGFARAADVALLYQALLRDESELWGRRVLDDVTGTVRVTQTDLLRGVPANRTRGLMLAGDDGHGRVRGFASTCSPGAFGHDGAAGQVAWADPTTGLSCCFLTTGIDRDVVRQFRRSIGVSDRAAAIACTTNEEVTQTP